MKKLSALVALVLCDTIGGVYAAWIYTGNTISSVERTISMGMETATRDGDVGTINVETNSLDLAIDQTAAGNYLAKMVFTGEIVVHFTPNPGAPEEVVRDAVPAKATLKIVKTDANKYEGYDIFVPTAVDSVPLTWVYENGAHHAHITADQIATLFTFGNEFVLPTYQDYTDFQNALHGLELVVVISADAQQ